MEETTSPTRVVLDLVVNRLDVGHSYVLLLPQPQHSFLWEWCCMMEEWVEGEGKRKKEGEERKGEGGRKGGGRKGGGGGEKGRGSESKEKKERKDGWKVAAKIGEEKKFEERRRRRR